MAIEPALTAEEWATGPRRARVEIAMSQSDGGIVQIREPEQFGRERPRQQASVEGDDLPALIALANAALPDTDPRKITRAMVEDIRHAAAEVATFHPQLDRLAAALDRHADALESYLPPDPFSVS
jgi:hypothetical protein